MERLDKILAGTGRWSRREVKELVRQGRVRVDGQTARTAEEKVDPEAAAITVDGQPVEERVVSSTGAYIMAYMAVVLTGALVVSWDNYGFQESFAASLTCISNVGPGLGILGPMENFSILSPLSKIALSLEMLTGRLELMPMLALLTRGAWRDR